MTTRNLVSFACCVSSVSLKAIMRSPYLRDRPLLSVAKNQERSN
ncbi:MAG TPA: hypothetical protein V6C58_16370 [Allocoleopsis sp.]